ncbi:uncharacterized protein [Oscarella lobularis]|uniref:uncharacterized protein isoform X2 n=1 Tax=Oscarella lobularis TaxID=121494 RepID=UPI0033139B4D
MIPTLLLALTLAAFAQALNNGLGLVPPMGWNTWCTLGRCGRDYCDAKEVMSVADAMVENGMRNLGWKYINLDDCWADHRDANGTIVADPSRFPDGIAAVVKYVNSKGFKFGLYTDAGEYTCSTGGRHYKIPGSYGHYEQDAQTYASWGVEYVKMDWCNTKINGTKLDPKVQYAQMSKALNATGKPIFFNSCEWGVESPWEWMKMYANSWRSGDDHADNWKSTAGIIEHNAGLSKYAGPGGWNDPDFLMTGGEGCADDENKRCPGMTDVEYKTEFVMWCILAAPLLVATDVRNMTDIQKQALFNAELIAVNQDKMGHQGDRLGFSNCSSKSDDCQIWAKNLTDNAVAVALFNAGDSTHNITFNFTLLPGWDSKSVHFRDLWEMKDVGSFQHSFTANDVPSHGVAVYKLTISA